MEWNGMGFLVKERNGRSEDRDRDGDRDRDRDRYRNK